MAHMHIGLVTILLLLLAFGKINAGITRQLDQLLPMRERITRSVPVNEDLGNLETIPREDGYEKHEQRLNRQVRSAKDFDLDVAENNVVFKPLFRKKLNRRIARSAPDLDDLQVAENNVVFKPLFRRRQNSPRIRREAMEDLETAENNIVFKPLFKRKSLRRVRSAEQPNYEEANVHQVDISDYVNEDDFDDKDDEEALETRRFRRDTKPDELMETAANTIVFRPLFRNSRRNLYRRGN